MSLKDDHLIFRCFKCKKNYKKDLNKEIIKRFENIYKFCNNDINKFILLLRKGIYPYEYIDSWERFDETLRDKETLYSNLNIKDITDVNYRHVKRVFKKFKNKNLGEYHGLYVQRIHYYLLMYLKVLEMNVLKYTNWILLILYQHLDEHGKLV